MIIDYNKATINDLIKMRSEISVEIKMRVEEQSDLIKKSIIRVIVDYIDRMKNEVGLSISSRKHPNVYFKHAMICALYQSGYWCGYSKIGALFDMHHSSVMYIVKSHDQRMDVANGYTVYIECFNKSKEILDEIIRKEQAN